ncbi:MAG: hypothetical protein JRH08_10460 [Deltaproteobacteria bacterium]|nr:hypothetical protein [Deltaproteobacteria bacterium]MBW1930489.1 hypothetical protein [Deltaproteobacteria bacterium]MBW2025456.1 hypothetical protein [Deltaproteobacteria bacterium]MBW2126100.1 hypothetical protein [Deltaproteobacteria bacterium]
MKITDSEVIRSGERDLIEGIIADLDWEAIDNLIKEKHGLEVEEDVEFRNGDLVVVENKIAYKLDFQVRLNISILLDREGNYLSLEAFTKAEDKSNSSNQVDEVNTRSQEDTLQTQKKAAQ